MIVNCNGGSLGETTCIYTPKTSECMGTRTDPDQPGGVPKVDGATDVARAASVQADSSQDENDDRARTGKHDRNGKHGNHGGKRHQR